jgi:hypothetical protein
LLEERTKICLASEEKMTSRGINIRVPVLTKRALESSEISDRKKAKVLFSMSKLSQPSRDLLRIF